MQKVFLFLAIAWSSIASYFLTLPVEMRGLLILMALDMGGGLTNAFLNHALDSGVAYKGIAKKLGILAIIVAANVLAPYLGPLSSVPVAMVATTFYIFEESISILENAAAIGIPIPKWLTDALAKLAQDNPPADPTAPAG